MIVEIALGIVLAVIILAFLPLILLISTYFLLFSLALAFVVLLGWGAYEIYQMFIQEISTTKVLCGMNWS